MPDIKFSNQYPYTDFHELNLDWIIKEVKYWSTKVGKTIQSIELTGTVGLVDTYTITYSDGTTSTYDVTNGAGIASIVKTGTAGLVDTYTITLQDGSTSTFDVTNGTAAIDKTLTLSDYAADAKVVGDDLPVTFPEISLVRENGARQADGSIFGSSTLYFHSSFALSTGDIIYLHYCDSYTPVVTLGYFDSSNVFHVVRQATGGSSEGDIRFVAPENINVSISGYGADFDTFLVNQVDRHTRPLFEIQDVIQPQIESDIDPLFPITFSDISLIRENGYRKVDGTTSGTTPLYFHSSFALSTGDIIYLHYCDAPAPVVTLGYFDSNNVFHVVRQATGGSSEGDIRFVAPGNINVSISGYGADFDTFLVNQVNRHTRPLFEIGDAILPMIIPEIESRVPWQFAIDNVLCIGDSLTRGTPPDTGSMPSPMAQNYPYYLARMINTTVTNAGDPGATTSQWYINHYASYNMSSYNAVIIFLGTNAPLTDTIDTDVDPYVDFNDYAPTETGYYCRLIKNIQADNSNSIIILVNLWSIAAGADTSRIVIDKIGAKYSLPVVQTYDLRYAVNPVYHGNLNNVHMTKTGYLALASRICTSLKDYFTNNTGAANTGMTL